MDELLRTVGVSHGSTPEETAQLQNEHPREREEYQALQDANLLTVQRLKAMVAQVRQCLTAFQKRNKSPTSLKLC